MNTLPLAALLAALSLLVAPCAAQQARARELWMAPPAAPDGRCWRELFAHPEQWKATRGRLTGLLYADHMLNRQFTDAELKVQFAAINRWGLKLQLEVGAIKEWGKTGAEAFEKQRPAWERFRNLGGRIHAIGLDEPLVCCREYLKLPDEYAVRETAEFIALVRKHYPEMLVGDIETYPSMSVADHRWWLDALGKRLATMGVRGLDFYRIDVDWVHFVVGGKGSWPEFRQVEGLCRQSGASFSLILWAANYPALQQRGLADDSTWYTGVMRMADDYAMVGGMPDQYVVESWVGAPSRAVPETGGFTFTQSVLDVARKHLKPAK